NFYFESYETGKLVYGDANPAHENFDSMADFCYGDGFVEIKLPWQLLNFSNPSDMQIHDDYYEHYGVENMKIDRMYVGVGDGADGQAIPLFESAQGLGHEGDVPRAPEGELLHRAADVGGRRPGRELWREDAATDGETTDAVVASSTS
ncbi:MAG: hypothetical protein ACLTEX_11700, partial [Eggerthella lenta]